ncbi:MAG: class I SAM-dependent methyltransferase [Rhodobacteraceae bacterium]|nr:class I SAM-dependent methyltransferase [Paracoccaceae bacterium]
MNTSAKHDAWSAGDSYEQYMGRWSRQVAVKYLDWLNAPNNLDWIDVGSGAGALSAAILDQCNPKSVHGIEQSEGFVTHAKSTITDDRAEFSVGDAQNLIIETGSIDVVSSALVLNFVPDKHAALTEMKRVAKPGGIVSFYVWDYPGISVGFMSAFWKAAAKLDDKAEDLKEGKRFPFCTPEGLTELCHKAGLKSVTVKAIDIECVFPTFDDFWHPFTLGAGPAPGYCMSLDEPHREALRGLLKETIGSKGEIVMPARAWAIKSEV